MASPPDNPVKRLVREVHRRSLWQVLGIYVVASWGVLSIVDTLGGAIGLPEWFPPFALALLVVGLPIVLATAFVQEGVRGRDPGDVEVAAPSARAAPRVASSLFTWRNALGGGVLAFALWGVVATGWVLFGGGLGSGEAPSSTEQFVAVLPFQNLSGDPEAEPFASGIHDDLLTRLSKVGALKVISWTSVNRYRDTPKSLPEIASELGVAWIVEGGVQRVGDRVRVNAQLIDPRTDQHVWAETYDRELSVENIFDIQSDVVQRIAEALAAELSPQEERQVAAGSTSSLEAYDLYQRGRFALNGRTAEGIRQAIDYFGLAAEQDSSYALASSGLSDALALGWYYGYDVDDEPLERARTMALRAVGLDPDLTEVHASLGWALMCLRDAPGAEAAFRRALDLDPNYTQAHHWYGLLLLVLGRPEEALEQLERSLQVDPLAPAVHATAGTGYMALDDIPRALRAWRRSVEIQSDYALGRLYLGKVLAFAGDTEGSIRETERARSGFTEKGDSIFGALASLAAAHALAGHADSARVLLNRAEREGTEPFHVGVAHAALGDQDTAFEWLGRSEWARGSVRWLRYHPALDPLRSDPRFDSLMAGMERTWGPSVPPGALP